MSLGGVSPLRHAIEQEGAGGPGHQHPDACADQDDPRGRDQSAMAEGMSDSEPTEDAQ